MTVITPPARCPSCKYAGDEGEDDDGIVFDAYGRCLHWGCDVVWWEHEIARLRAALKLKETSN